MALGYYNFGAVPRFKMTGNPYAFPEHYPQQAQAAVAEASSVGVEAMPAPQDGGFSVAGMVAALRAKFAVLNGAE